MMGYDRLVWLGMRLIRRVIPRMIYVGDILLGIESWREFYVLLMGFMYLIRRDDLIKHGLLLEWVRRLKKIFRVMRRICIVITCTCTPIGQCIHMAGIIPLAVRQGSLDLEDGVQDLGVVVARVRGLVEESGLELGLVRVEDVGVVGVEVVGVVEVLAVGVAEGEAAAAAEDVVEGGIDWRYFIPAASYIL